MSAFVVDRQHTDAMVRVAVHGPRSRALHNTSWYGPSWVQHWSEDWQDRTYVEASMENVQELADMLHAECEASVKHRYPDWEETGLPGTIGQEDWTYSGPGGWRPTAVEALKLIGCYRYQSCEHPGWEGSEAKRFCDALTDCLICALPGYSEAVWGFDGERVTA